MRCVTIYIVLTYNQTTTDPTAAVVEPPNELYPLGSANPTLIEDLLPDTDNPMGSAELCEPHVKRRRSRCVSSKHHVARLHLVRCDGGGCF
mgnify:FL=1